MQMFSNAMWAQVYFCNVKSEIPSLSKGFGMLIGRFGKGYLEKLCLCRVTSEGSEQACPVSKCF